MTQETSLTNYDFKILRVSFWGFPRDCFTDNKMFDCLINKIYNFSTVYYNRIKNKIFLITDMDQMHRQN